ncbi:MAG: aromatic ring-hydroxylating oxygenase subunit alpha [Steroidobacteraceae bacterium]
MQDSLGQVARGSASLPGHFFHAGEAYALEVDRFFRRQWFCLALGSDVPNSGDWFPVDAIGQSLLICRDADGKVRCFHNVCSHRGAQLVSGPKHARVLVCPYHCWSYDTKGRLARTPHAGGAGLHDDVTIDRTNLGLREILAVERGGLVFVCLAAPAEDFDSRIGPLFDRWFDAAFSELEQVPDIGQRPSFRANWKIVVENFVESYHLPSVHPELNRANPMERHYQILGGDRYIGQGTTAYVRDDQSGNELPLLPGVVAHDRSMGEALYLVPNLLIIRFPDFVLVNIVFPVSAVVTEERIELLVHRDAASGERHRAAREGLMRFLINVNNEDVAICESVQKGRASEAFRGGVFTGGQESTSLRFQQILARCLTDESTAALPNLSTLDIYHSTGTPTAPTGS